MRSKPFHEYSRSEKRGLYWMDVSRIHRNDPDAQRPDSPTGDVIAGVDGVEKPQVWLAPYECPRRIIGEVTDPDLEMLHDLHAPSIDDIEKSARRKARKARAEWHRLWSGGDDAAARVQKGTAHAYDELHRLIRVARAHRINATLRQSARDRVVS